jgi:hypothetical protein
MATKLVKIPEGYEVFDEQGVRLGWMTRIYPPSHIRRGRAQTSPWWAPETADGRCLNWKQSRVAAVAALIAAL